MGKTLTGNNPLRLKYEEVYGKKIRHSQWLNIRLEILSADLALNTATITAYAQFKKILPRKVLTKTAFKKLSDFAFTHQGLKQHFSGAELETIIEKNTTMPEWAFYRCFYRTGLKFSKERLYTFDESYRVLTFAYTYKSTTTTTKKKERCYGKR